MCHELINRSGDLKRLRDEGYEIEVKEGYALIHNIPYVNSRCEIKRGTILSKLVLSGDVTATPDNHVAYFMGDQPCNKDGSVIKSIYHSLTSLEFSTGSLNAHMLSNKPREGFTNYYDKFISYINIISDQASSLDNSVTARTYKPIKSSDDSIFNYYDTNTSRSNIGTITQKLEGHRIAIIGLGGTGSYVLDLVAKTPVKEIHLFDGDDFLQHNAFRAPGAPSIAELREKKKKTDYFYNIYKNMHKNIVSHSQYIGEENINDLLSMDFVFICIDTGPIKYEIVRLLVDKNIPFIDTGIGVNLIDDSLIGIVRLTLSTQNKSDHLKDRISFADNDKNDEYSTNIQIAELNALNAALAVIKWKKHIGFYQDINKEHDIVFTINDGEIHNEDRQD